MGFPNAIFPHRQTTLINGYRKQSDSPPTGRHWASRFHWLPGPLRAPWPPKRGNSEKFENLPVRFPGGEQAFSARTDAEMALVTQFCFEAEPVIAWVERLQREGITLPGHIGIAGPAKLQTMIKFAMTCGIGPSLRVLQRRARDVAKLVLPFTPREILTDLAIHKAHNPGFGIAQVHFFPLGGISKTAEFTNEFGAARALSRVASA